MHHIYARYDCFIHPIDDVKRVESPSGVPSMSPSYSTRIPPIHNPSISIIISYIHHWWFNPIVYILMIITITTWWTIGGRNAAEYYLSKIIVDCDKLANNLATYVYASCTCKFYYHQINIRGVGSCSMVEVLLYF